ncbi:hypothetical protein CcI49_37755 [Frankia sp. CcI49]|uniref:hypothetical protein n=1 Tax=unclassified Frankia TaxID=2632575 RepID=UPI0006C9F951|nr:MULTISPECIES: hypothetical protein [unclassified Frankia]KPM56107.1 hypothetical protein ACG83_13235 [Frankia sp. R43]ONH50044.1 hypothetical protein CcI49_37755 [Frankia sp. CcI49]
MNRIRVERLALGGSAFFAVASSVIGFRWVASPYFRGYASAAAVCYLLSRLAAASGERQGEPSGKRR